MAGVRRVRIRLGMRGRDRRFQLRRCGRELAGGLCYVLSLRHDGIATTARSDKPQISNVRAGACFNQWKLPDGSRAMDKVKMLADRISPILHGHKPEIQGAVLAELLATWLSGHVCRVIGCKPSFCAVGYSTST